MSKKLFVGGYYDDRIFNDVEEKTPFSKEISSYTLEEVLKLGFVENVIDWYKEKEELEWDEISEEEKIKSILEYTESDEIAGVLYFKTEAEAEKFKSDTIKEVEELEKESDYVGKKQDSYGNFREVYRKII